MRIYGNGIKNVLDIYKNQEKVSGKNKIQTSKKSDELNISETARDFQYALEQVKKQPEIRQEKVEKIKQQIKTGTYEINSTKIAEKIIESSNIDIKL